MALPIKPTPTLKGDRVIDFYKEIEKNSNAPKKELVKPDSSKITKLLKEKYKN